jgi:hypothetical protein
VVAVAKTKFTPERVAEMQALGRFLGEPAGRRWLYQLMTECNVWTTSGVSNALSLAFREGSRFVGLRLQAEAMQANHDMYLKMLKEMEVERPGAIGTRGFGTDDPDGDTGIDADI